MQGLYSLLSVLVLALILSGCAPKAVAQAEEIEAPADLPGKSNPTRFVQSEIVSTDAPADCPLTVPPDPPFTPPAPYSELGFEGGFWYGSDSLWTIISLNGIWAGLPRNPEGYTQKIFWWRDGYVWMEEPEPALTVTGERLDAAAPPLIASKATNAYASDIGSAMLVGVDFPTLGCWKITGKYGHAELSFVVWVAPE